MTVPGGDKLCHSKRSQIQPGHAHLPPMAGQQTGVRPELYQQGGGRRVRAVHADGARDAKQ